MKEEALLRGGRGRLRFVFLPVLVAGAVVSAVAAYGSAPPVRLALVLFSTGCAFASGVLVAAELPGARALALRARELSAVSAVIGKAGGSLELQEVLDAITGSTVAVSGVHGCSIRLLDPDGRTMSVRSAAGLGRHLSSLRTAAAEGIASRSLLEGKPIHVDGTAREDFPELDGSLDSLVCVPLRHAGKVIGALCAYGDRGTRLPAHTLSFLSRLGDLAVLSIANASIYDSLKKLDETKTWFMRKAAHELAAPLSAIRSLTQNLLLGYHGELSAEQKAELDRVIARAAGLSETVTDLLSLARGRSHAAPAGSAQRTGRTDLCRELSRAVAFYQPAARQKEVKLEIDAPCSPCLVDGATESVASILSNLVSNAIKYSRPGGTVGVRIAREAAAVELVVRDEGIGIPAGEKEKVGAEFYRASNARSLTEEGTGLGLAIVRAEVDSLGGSFQLESEEGVGTTARVRLPLPSG
jgi:signal transduction histidine kinase